MFRCYSINLTSISSPLCLQICSLRLSPHCHPEDRFTDTISQEVVQAGESYGDVSLNISKVARLRFIHKKQLHVSLKKKKTVQTYFH